jgi:DnaJ-class molecular chaperone
VAAALATLYVAPDAPETVIKAVYRALAKATHPDTGGDHASMKALNAAYELSLPWAATHGARLAASA